MATIQGIYIALFGRPADPLGLAFFNEATNEGADLTAIGDLAATAEYQARFEGMSNTQVVTAIYQELFGRNPELAGLTFFVNALNSGELNINNVAIAILDGAQGTDKELVDAKIAAADQFTAAVAADTDALAAYQGEAGAEFGRAFLDQVDAPDVEFTDAEVAAQVEAFGEGNPDTGVPGTPGAILTLSASADVVSPSATAAQFKSTADDDTIRAIDANSLGSSDVIDGGAGFDVLNISNGAIAGGSAAPIISNVERINNSDGTATLALAGVTGLQQLWSNAADTEAFTYTGVTVATVVGSSGLAAGETHTINIDYAGSLAGETTANLATANTGGTAEFVFTGADANGVEAISLNAASGTGTATFDGLAFLETVTVSGAGRVTADTDATSITTFNASANTGGVSWQSAALVDEATVTGGAGNDVFNLSAALESVTITSGAGSDIITGGTVNDTIDAGAGNDIVNGSTGADVITLGEGNDFVVYTNVNQSQFVAAGPNNTMDTITDFNVAGNDTINLDGIAALTAVNGGVDLIAIQSAVDGLAGTATLADALATITAANSTVGEVSYFTFQGDTYVVGDLNANGFAAADDFVLKLSGVVELTAADFVF